MDPVAHGLEVKTILPQDGVSDGPLQITTQPHARAAKAAWQRENQQNAQLTRP